MFGEFGNYFTNNETTGGVFPGTETTKLSYDGALLAFFPGQYHTPSALVLRWNHSTDFPGSGFRFAFYGWGTLGMDDAAEQVRISKVQGCGVFVSILLLLLSLWHDCAGHEREEDALAWHSPSRVCVVCVCESVCECV